MAGQLQLEILTPDGAVYNEAVYEVVVPTLAGDLGILPHHIPIAAATKLGVVSVRRNQQDTNTDLDHFVIGEGLLEVSQDKVRLLVDEAEHTASIEVAQARHEERLKEHEREVARQKKEIATTEASVKIDH